MITTFSTFVVNFHSQLFSTFLNFFSTSQLFSQLLFSTFILKIVLNFLNFFSTFSTVLNCSRLFLNSAFILQFHSQLFCTCFHGWFRPLNDPHRIVPLTATPGTHSLFSFSHEVSVQMFENATREYLRIERDTGRTPAFLWILFSVRKFQKIVKTTPQEVQRWIIVSSPKRQVKMTTQRRIAKRRPQERRKPTGGR